MFWKPPNYFYFLIEKFSVSDILPNVFIHEKYLSPIFLNFWIFPMIKIKKRENLQELTSVKVIEIREALTYCNRHSSDLFFGEKEVKENPPPLEYWLTYLSPSESKWRKLSLLSDWGRASLYVNEECFVQRNMTSMSFLDHHVIYFFVNFPSVSSLSLSNMCL